MKYLSFVFLSVVFLSCGFNKEEQLLYDFKKANLKANHFLIDELDFSIEEMVRVEDVTGLDSMKFYKNVFFGITTENTSFVPNAELTFEEVKDYLNKIILLSDTLKQQYQKSVIDAMVSNCYSCELEAKRKRNKAIDQGIDSKIAVRKIEKAEISHNKFAENTSMIYALKYKATYSYNNPMLLGARQTFTSYFIVDSGSTMILKEESAAK